jgi:hypothetical protein
MMKKNRVLSVITAITLAASTGTFNFVNAISVPVISSEKENKMSKELEEVLNTIEDSELIPVEIIIKDLDHSIINKMIENESDYDTLLYKDIGTYDTIVAPEIIREEEEKFGFENAHLLTLKDPDTDEIIYTADNYFDSSTVKGKMYSALSADIRSEFIVSKVSEEDKKKYASDNFGMSKITKRISDDIDRYMAVRRSCVTRAYEDYNYNMIKNYLNSDHIICNAGFAPYLIVEADKNSINRIANDESVVSIDYFVDKELEPSLATSNSLTGVTAVQSSAYNSGSGYTGAGVTVGVIEAASGKYKSTYSMLNGCSNLQFIVNDGITGNDTPWHATLVTSIIKGKSVYENGVYYRGVAPDANVYQTCCNYLSNVPSTIQLLASYGCSVINHSANLKTSLSYSHDDWLVDNAIRNYGIVFVVSAGNDTTNVQSPANSYDCIAVGNLNVYGESLPYDVYSTSAYAESIYMTNKPDVVAPGTHIIIPDYYDTGTSFSAPMVAGMAAQILQCKPSLRLPTSTYNNATYYDAVKACIIVGADPTKVSTTDNSVKGAGTCASLIRNKTGAGLVNVKKTIDVLTNNGYYYGLKKIDLNPNGTSPEGMNFFTGFETGDKIRAVLCFSKLGENQNSDLDLILYDSNMNVIATSVSAVNNVEIIEYDVPIYGNYFLSVEVNPNGDPITTGTLPGAVIYSETWND